MSRRGGSVVGRTHRDIRPALQEASDAWSVQLAQEVFAIARDLNEEQIHALERMTRTDILGHRESHYVPWLVLQGLAVQATSKYKAQLTLKGLAVLGALQILRKL